MVRSTGLTSAGDAPRVDARPGQGGRPAHRAPEAGRRAPVAHDALLEEEAEAASSAPDPPPLPWTLVQAPAFEREVSVDGFRLGTEPGPLVPPFLAQTRRGWSAAASDVRLTGLGWTEEISLEHGLTAPRWAVSGRWAPPAFSARPAAVGLGGTAVAEGPEGVAVAAPRGAWRASGLLGGPLARGRVGAVLSLDATGLGLPATEPGLAAGGRARQSLAFTTTWLPSAEDRLELLVLAGRRTESPDCFRCTDAAARLDRELAVLAGVSWRHALGAGTGLELRLSAERRTLSAGARTPPAGPSHLDLSTWVTDGAPGALGPDVAASALDGSRIRVQLASRVHSVLGMQRLEGGLEARVETGQSELSVPEGVRFLDRGGPCVDGQTSGCAFRVQVAPAGVETRGWMLGAHLEDAIQLGVLGLRAGVRLDAGQAGAGDISTGLRVGVGPRLALAWNVVGDGRHWFLLHAGRSHDLELQSVVTRSVGAAQRVASFSDGAFDACARPGLSCVQLGGPAALAPGGLPHSDEVALGWRGQLARGLEGGVEARVRHTAQLWTEAEIGLLTDERGRWIGADGVWRSRRVVSADGRAWRRALGLGAWAHAHAGPARVSVAWKVAQVTGTAAGPFDPWLLDARTAALAAGPLPDDQRHRVSVSLTLRVHPVIELGTRLRYATGAPLWETFSVPDSAGLRTVQAARGTGVLRSGVVALRDPDVFAADAWIRFRVGALLPAAVPRLDLTVEAAQVAGGNTPLHLSASSSRLGAVLRREPPLQLVLGLRAGN